MQLYDWIILFICLLRCTLSRRKTKALGGGRGFRHPAVFKCKVINLWICFFPIGELNHEGDKVLVAKGGLGGSLHSGFLPSKGHTRHIRLDLRLIADLGLVG